MIAKRFGLTAAVLALCAVAGLTAAPLAAVRAETSVASIVGPPAVAKGASVPFIVSVDPPPEHRIDVLVHLSHVGAGASGDDMGRRSLAVGPSGTAHLLVPTEDDGVDGVDGVDGQIRVVLIGDGHSYRPSRTVGTATVQVRDVSGGSGRDAPVVSLTAPLSVAEGADAAVVVSASPLPRDLVDVALAVRAGRGGVSSGAEETRTLTLGRDGFAQIALATEDDEVAEPDRLTVVEVLPSGTGAYRVSRDAASVQMTVLDDDWTTESNPYPTLSIVAPPVAQTGAESAFIVVANPPPAPGGSMAVPLRFGHHAVDAETLLFQQTGGAGVVQPRDLDGELPVVQLRADGLAYVSFTGTLEVGADRGLVSAAIVGSPDGAYRVSEGRGQAVVRIARMIGAGTGSILPRVSIRAPESAFEGQHARFLLFADPVPPLGGSIAVTVRVAPGGGAQPTLPEDCCSVTIGDNGWGVLEVEVPEDSEPGAGAWLTATVLEPAPAAYLPAASASLRTATVRIVDDDGPPAPLPAVAISAPNDIGEGGEALFLLTANPPPASDLRVRVAITRGGEHVAVGDTGLVGGSEGLVIDTNGFLSFGVSTRDDDGARGADGWVRARLLRDDADPYRIAGSSLRHVRIRDNGASRATPQLSITAPSAIGEGGQAPFLLSAAPPPLSPLAVSVVVRESGGQYVADGEYTDADQRSIARDLTIPATGALTFFVATRDDEEHRRGGTLTAAIQASESSPPDYRIALGRASVRVQDDDPTTPPAPVEPPSFSVRPVAARAPAGTHAHFLLTADRKYEASDAPSVRMVIRTDGEAVIDPERQRLLPLTANGGCDANADGGDLQYPGLRDVGLPIPEGAVYLCVPTAEGDGAVRLTLGNTFDSDNYRTAPPTSARVAVDDGRGPASEVPVVSVVGPPTVGVGALAGFVVSYAAAPPEDALTVRLHLSGAVTGVEELVLPPSGGIAEFAVAVPAASGAGQITATLVEPPDSSADGYYVADPDRSSARVAVVNHAVPLPVPVPVLSIGAPPTVVRGGVTAFLLSAAPVPAQPIAATVASAAWRRIVPMDQRGVALLALRADLGSPFESDGVLGGCLRDDPSGLYRVAGPGAACASIQILPSGSDGSDSNFTTVSLAAPPTVGGGGRAALLLSADPPPGPSGLHVRMAVTPSAGGRDVLWPGEAGMRTEFIGADGVALVRVLTQNVAGGFSASIPAAAATDPYRRDETAHSVAVAVRSVGDQAVRLPTVAATPGPRTVEGGTVEFVVASTPPTPGLTVRYRLSGDGLPSGNEETGRVVLDGQGRAVVRVDTMDDGRSEPDGALTITLLPGDGHRLEAGEGTATVAIVDDDAPADTPRLALASAGHALEGAPARFALSADPPPAAPAIVTVDIGQRGGAVAASRLGVKRITLPTSGYVRFSVPTLDNAVADRGGEVTAAIGEPAHGMRVESARGLASVAVVDDDRPASSLTSVSLLAPSTAWEGERVDLDVVADGRPSQRRLRVRICLQGAGSLHPEAAVSHGWSRLGDDGQAVLSLWPGVPNGAAAAPLPADCEETGVTTATLAAGTDGAQRLAVHIGRAPGYRPSASGNNAIISVRKR